MTRTRAARGAPLEVVEVDREYVNTADPAYAVDPEARPEIKRAAERAAKRQQARKAKRSIVATFRSPAVAAAQLYSHNPYLHELAEADPGDLVREWMDPIWVRRGKGRARFAATKAGRQILELSYRSPAEWIKAALQWIIQQSGTRRWVEVDWSTMDELPRGVAQRDEAACTYASLLDDIDKLQEACTVPYDPEWPVGAVTRAIEQEGEDAPRTFDFPAAVKRHVERSGVKPRPKPTVRSGRDEVRTLRGALRRDI